MGSGQCHHHRVQHLSLDHVTHRASDRLVKSYYYYLHATWRIAFRLRASPKAFLARQW